MLWRTWLLSTQWSSRSLWFICSCLHRFFFFFLDYPFSKLINCNYNNKFLAEGDNYLLTQQTSRYLVKSFQQNLQGQYKAVSEYTKYLEKPIDLLNSEKCSVTKSCSEFLDPKVQMDLYAHRAGRNVANLVEKLEKGLSDVNILLTSYISDNNNNNNNL